MKTLHLQVNPDVCKIKQAADAHNLTTPRGGLMMITPPIGEDYWLFRVAVSDKQAIVGFPKFFTIGIGFQREEDWNTNLPYLCPAEKIYQHIAHNKGDGPTEADCLEAIKIVQAAAHQLKGTDPAKDKIE